MRTETTTSHTKATVMPVDGGEAKVYANAEVTHFTYGTHPREVLNKKARLFWEDNWTGSSASKEFVLGEQPAITRRGDDAESDKAWDRYNKQNVRIVRDAIVAVLQEMVGYRYTVTGKDVRYSRKAGCTCNCSPGFILSDDLRHALEQGCRTEVGIADVRVRLNYHSSAR